MLLLLASVVYVSGSVCGANVLRLVRIQVHGRVVDAATGESLAGVFVVPMWDLASRERAIELKKRLETGDARTYRGGITVSDGTFSFEHSVYACTFESSWLPRPESWTPAPFFGVGALLIGRTGGEDAVVDTRAGSWRSEPSETGASASLEMGDVRYKE
ncbi:MAG TPA: hypothetical protein VFY93_06045 [Planctomycetota bacterium]|nr:hypothetical protein [Planctomycetota bacterium]